MKREDKMLFKHYKGNIYEVICEAHLESNEQKMVVYRRNNSNETWVRPYEEFYGKIEMKGKQIPRFVEITSGDFAAWS
jgi:hypothetical protein